MLNGSIIEYEDYGSIVGLDVIRLSGGGTEFDDFMDPMGEMYTHQIWGTGVPPGTFSASPEKGTISPGGAGIQTAVDIFRTVGEASRALKRVKRGFTSSPKSSKFIKREDIMSSMPLNYSNVSNASGWNITIPSDKTHGGPGIQTSGYDRIRLAGAQIMSTYTKYLCTSYANKSGVANTYRQEGADQPLYMNIRGPFQDKPNMPFLPITSVSENNLKNIAGICFNVQWPGIRMHEDTATKDSTNTNIYSKWLPIIATEFDRTVNVDFDKVLLNEFWRKMVIGNVHLRMEFHNHSTMDHMIHIIWYTNKRKGIKYANEFTQWINSVELDDVGNNIIASDFYQKGILPMKPPCKILRHKKFILRAKPQIDNFGGYSNTNGNHGTWGYKSGANRKVVKMKSSSGYTLKRDNLTSMTTSTNEDDWLESTNVEEERMIYCQIMACPIRYRVKISTSYLQTPWNGTDYKKVETSQGSTAQTHTQLQQMPEVYRSFLIASSSPAEYQNIPGIEVDIRRKVYFKVDKEIELS